MRRRVPVVLQMNSVECAAACLTMILCYFGRRTRLEECRAKCDPGRDGVTAQTIVSAAQAFGLRTKALWLSAHDFSRQPVVPCIVHWNNSHFVVLERWSDVGVEIVDPSSGRCQLSASEFESAFSGTALYFEPGPELKTHLGRTGPNLLDYLKRLLRISGTSRVLAQILTASLVLQAFGLALPLFTKEVVDNLLPLRNREMLDWLVIGALLAALTSAAVSYFRSALLIRLQTSLDSHLMSGFFKHLLSLPFRFFQQRSSGDLLMRLASNASIRDALASYTTSSILDGTLVVVFLAVIFRVSTPFGIAVLAIAIVETSILLVTAGRLHRLTESDIACQSASQSCLVESLIGMSTIKASGAEQSTLDRWAGLLARQLDTSAQRSRYAAGVSSSIGVIRTFSPLFLLWLGSSLVLNDSMSLGTMLAVNALAASFLEPVGSLVLVWQRLQLANAHLERIADVMQAAPEQDLCRVGTAPRLSGRIELRNVSFRYDTHGPKILDNISLTILPGQKVAIVGRTGSGKSTLAKLLLGLYLPTEGEILYDGIPLDVMNFQTLRSQWGTVLQDSFLFSTSLRENISFHNPEISSADLVRAAEIAEIHSEIMQMPMRYETRIDEGGSSLSGGQCQRLAIARAVASKPPLLLLDEATSHLDVVTESLVDRNLDALLCTRVVIAHRLSTIQNADFILVFEGGSIVELGSHHKLLAKGGVYAALVRSQLAEDTKAPM